MRMCISVFGMSGAGACTQYGLRQLDCLPDPSSKTACWESCVLCALVFYMLTPLGPTVGGGMALKDPIYTDR